MNTIQLKEKAIINGVEEFVWSITFYAPGEYYDHASASFRLHSGKVHHIKENDIVVWPEREE